MAKFDVDGIQNVEVSRKLPPQMTPDQQLDLMEQYTRVYDANLDAAKEQRELACLQVLYPALLRRIEPDDLFAGRLDFLPIGFGCVTSLGGVGHYCVFGKLKALKEKLDGAGQARLDALYQYWLDHDLKTLYCKDVLTDDTIGRFIDCEFPLIATARLSGMMLDYEALLEGGVDGLRARISRGRQKNGDNAFYRAGEACLDLFCTCARHYAAQARDLAQGAADARAVQLQRMTEDLEAVCHGAPVSFPQALQLFWLYALLAGVINYGRLDDLLGPYLARDLAEGRLTEDEAYEYMKCLWRMIENRRTTVNGRIIVGGYGRKHPAQADIFLRLGLRAAAELRYVEPQFTLRITKDTPEDVWDVALESLGRGATYPTLYNDEVNVPAVMHAMRVDRSTAEQYVPFGCGEYVIAGQSTGTPNTCINLLKLLQIALNNGIDPMDGKKKCGPVALKPAAQLATFEELWQQYTKLLDYYLDLSIQSQTCSYRIMNREVSFLFTSLLMDDCIARGKAVLDGGVRYLGGTNETYGNINTSDALWAVKDLVYGQKKYTLPQLVAAANRDFKGPGDEAVRLDLWRCDKYGNDLDTADAMADRLYQYVANGVRDRGIAAGMQYYLIVISNNQLNTEWGRRTAASLDGRRAGQYMNPANNPQGGANTRGPTAMLNSLAKFDARLHGASVQNIKFSTSFFRDNRNKIKALFRTYFKRGGCHLMVTVIQPGVLEDAVKHPEKYPDLIVRVSGFSAVFVNLEPDIQKELMSRVLYD